ncbi:hypothetical protein MNBD_GAMMA15-2059 [hydrothermal vent metagenome]|uniref:Flagellar hook-length control protein-like C-terminal domain-containing protein n=1 Tax=hydrothermal vent metagenome TaxID=652676 RepID=A0A3B0Z7Q4_9ZZZZ
MNASLPTLPISSSSADGASFLKGDILLNQQPGSTPGGFGPLLEQAVGALGEQPATPAESMELLPGQLQSLPQGGKLLPLLQQVLDAAAAEGTDASAVLENIAAKLEQLTVDTNLDPEQAVATALQQFIDENPRIATSVDTGLLRGLSAQSEVVASRDSSVRAQTGLTPQKYSAETVTINAGLATAERATELAPQRPLTSLEKLPVELLPITPEQRDIALREVVAQFKRLASGSAANNSLSDILPRTESLLSALSPATASAPVTATPPSGGGLPSVSLGVPLNQAGWDKALGERIQWLAGKGVQQANIKLNPAHLGPMEVRIQIQNDQASVQFSSTHGVVREALEAALPRLREMFDASGVELADVDVSGQSFAEQRQSALDSQDAGAGNGQNGDFDSEDGVEMTLETPIYSLPVAGRLDLFV